MLQRSYNPFKRFMLGGGVEYSLHQLRWVVILINKTREQIALSFKFLVGKQKFARVKARFAFQP